MLRIRSTRLLSGVSAIAVIAGAGMLSPVMADPTYHGPITYQPITNDQFGSGATVTIDLDATIDRNGGTNPSNTSASTNGDSFYNGLSMTGLGAKLTVDDSFLVGDIENVNIMTSSDSTAILIGNDSQIGGRLFNSGTIGSTGAGTDGILVTADSTIGGGIANVGTIFSGTGTGDAIDIGLRSEVFSGIFNSGVIEGSHAGIDISDIDADLRGGINNSGTILSHNGGVSGAAIFFTGDVFTGGITNSASIVGLSGADGFHMAIGAGTFSEGIVNSGLFAGKNGIRITGGTFTGGILNNTGGTIQGNGGVGAIWFEGKGGATFSGGITNKALIQGIGTDGIHMDSGTLNGLILNDTAGTITVTGGDGIDIAGGSLVNGIENRGKILAGSATAGHTGIYIHGTATFAGGITNSGTVKAANTGILITNTSFAGGIHNTGLIQTDGVSGDGIHATSATFTGAINNDGTIDAAETGIFVNNATSFTGGLTNSGTVIARNAQGIWIGGPSFTGDVVNTGLVNAASDALHIATTLLTGNVTNDGSLIAAGTYGIYIGATTEVTGDVTNGGEGLIQAGVTGIYVFGTVDGAVTNNGIIDPTYGMTIGGSASSVSNTNYIEATNDGIRIINGGTIDNGIANSGTIIAGLNAINLSGEGAATGVTQTNGLLRGNSATNGSGTVTTALRLDQTGTEYVDTFTGKRGTVDGNIVGGGSDNVDTNVSNGQTFAFMRGTASGLSHFDGAGNGTVLLGAATRGVDGAGVMINTTDHMFFSGKGRLYLDDNTQVNLTGYYTQQVDRTVEFYLTSNTAQHGQIAAGGEGEFLDGHIAAFVNGSTFGGVGGDTFTYANVMLGTTNGTFTNASDIEINNSLFFSGKANVFATHVDIVLHRGSFADALILPGMTQNETTMGNVLDDIYALGPGAGGYGTDFAALFDYLLSLGNNPQDIASALAIYNELDGAEHAQLQQTTLDILNPFNGFMGQRLDQAKTSQGGVGFAAFGGGNQYAQAAAVMSDASPGMTRGDSGFSLWARGYGQTLRADGDPEAPGYDQNTGGAVGGVDLAIGQNSIIGAAAGWSTTDVDFKTPGDKASVDSFQVGAYGSAGFGRFYLDAEVAGAFHDLSTTRFLNLPNPPGGMVAGADYNARSLAANGEFGAVWRSGNFIFQPNAGVMFTDVDTDAIIESGAGDFNLIIHDSSAQSLASSVGARFATQFRAGGMNIMPEISGAWRHEFDDDRQTFTAAFPDDPTSTFNIISSKINPDSALVEAGVTAGVTKNVEIFLNYNGLLNSDVDVHNGSAGLRATW
jgi:uncharacterized protein with beta-barrel porin domain